MELFLKKYFYKDVTNIILQYTNPVILPPELQEQIKNYKPKQMLIYRQGCIKHTVRSDGQKVSKVSEYTYEYMYNPDCSKRRPSHQNKIWYI
jgi:hypothetical protein